MGGNINEERVGETVDGPGFFFFSGPGSLLGGNLWSLLQKGAEYLPLALCSYCKRYASLAGWYLASG